MGARLDPAERDRRAAERRRKTFSGENYKTYNVVEEGFGSFREWAGIASAFVNGETFFEIASDAAPKTKKKTNQDPILVILGLEVYPSNLKDLNSAYRKAVFAAFRDAGSKDTAPEYVKAFKNITLAFERIKNKNGW